MLSPCCLYSCASLSYQIYASTDLYETLQTIAPEAVSVTYQSLRLDKELRAATVG
jgi:hypothetical protein